jgi:hypothetical protein
MLRETPYDVAPVDAVHESAFCPSSGVTVTPVGGAGGTQAGVAATWDEYAELQDPLLAVTT